MNLYKIARINIPLLSGNLILCQMQIIRALKNELRNFMVLHTNVNLFENMCQILAYSDDFYMNDISRLSDTEVYIVRWIDEITPVIEIMNNSDGTPFVKNPN